MASEGHPKTSEDYPKILEGNRRFPKITKITEDGRRLLEDFRR